MLLGGTWQAAFKFATILDWIFVKSRLLLRVPGFARGALTVLRNSSVEFINSVTSSAGASMPAFAAGYMGKGLCSVFCGGSGDEYAENGGTCSA